MSHPTPQRHPRLELLAGLAGGGLDAATRVLLETHVERCVVCGPRVAELAGPGARLLEKIAPVAPPPAVFDRVLATVTGGSPSDVAPRDPALGALPAAARDDLEPQLARDGLLAWRRIPLSDARFAFLRREPGIDVLAVELGPSRRFPRHRHLGEEQAVILAGGYTDASGVYEAGDWAVYPAGSEHAPLTHPEGPCRIVTRVAGGVRFTGWLGVLQAIGDAFTRRRGPRG